MSYTPNDCVTAPLKLLPGNASLDVIRQFRQAQYQPLYPNINNLKEDRFDPQAHIIYSTAKHHHINSTGRLVVDHHSGLPEEEIFHDFTSTMRTQGYRMAEFGRFTIKESSAQLVKAYYRSIYQLALLEQISIVLMVMRKKDFPIHRRLMCAEKLPCTPIDNGFGSQHTFISVAWWLEKTPPRFFQWCGAQPQLP